MVKTLARALKDRKTIANELSTISMRAYKDAVITTDESKSTDFKPDFNTQEYTQKYLETQHRLRELKTGIANKTSSTLVKIPSEVPVPEAGTEVPLFQAILIRDDLKSQKIFFDRFLNISIKDSRYNHKTEEYEEIKKERQFDFEKTRQLVDNLQDYIDNIDALIQFTDNTTEL